MKTKAVAVFLSLLALASATNAAANSELQTVPFDPMHEKVQLIQPKTIQEAGKKLSSASICTRAEILAGTPVACADYQALLKRSGAEKIKAIVF